MLYSSCRVVVFVIFGAVVGGGEGAGAGAGGGVILEAEVVVIVVEVVVVVVVEAEMRLVVVMRVVDEGLEGPMSPQAVPFGWALDHEYHHTLIIIVNIRRTARIDADDPCVHGGLQA
jgi:hypothetical protein